MNGAQIFLADQRGRTESSAFRSLHTFSFGKFQQDHRKPFFGLHALNDETLSGQQSVTHRFAETLQVCVLPLVGGINFKINENDTSFIEAGECAIFSLKNTEYLKIENPYGIELVNYLLLAFSTDALDSSNSKLQFDLVENANSFQELFSTDKMKLSIGKFGGRVDSDLSLSPGTGVFAFVIEGAFEFDNRLIQQRDGLSLSSSEKIEFEALSNDAILLVMEFKDQKSNEHPISN